MLPATGKMTVTDQLVRFMRPGLTEEYSISVDGVRQDFIIESPPLNAQASTLTQSTGELCVEVAVTGARVEPSALGSGSATGAKLTLDGSGRALAYSRLRATDAVGQELTARMEVLSADRLAVLVDDTNATYPIRIDPTFSDADWLSLNPELPGANVWVSSIVADGSGNLYVGGAFTYIASVAANRIAKWNGSEWSALGEGVSADVGELGVFGTDLWVGGYFNAAGGVAANNIATWDGKPSSLRQLLQDLSRTLNHEFVSGL
jgi:hypothetical protein